MTHVIFMYDHVPCDVVVDIYIPMTAPPVSDEELSQRYCPACPICKTAMRYAAYGFRRDEDDDDDKDEDKDKEPT